MPHETTVARYAARTIDFIRSASVLCTSPQHGWLPSACLLLGFACELLAKRRLLLASVPEEALSRPPYGHDIAGMWKDKTTLYADAEDLVADLLKNPNPKGVHAGFDWHLHFEQLARGHSNRGQYSLRYHQGEIHFADPVAMTVVLGNLWSRDCRQSPE